MAEEEPKQIAIMKQLVTLSLQRSEMSEVRSYHNAERTLSVWLRTALALMICGLAIDRFGLILGGDMERAAHGAFLDLVSTWTSVALVLLGALMAATTGLRFLAYARTWRRRHTPPAYHGPYLASFFAAMVTLFGLLLLAIMIAAVTTHAGAMPGGIRT